MLGQNLDKQRKTSTTGYRTPSMRQGKALVTIIQLKPTDTDRRMGATVHERLTLCPLRKNKTLWPTPNSNTGRSTIRHLPELPSKKGRLTLQAKRTIIKLR
jgi:hypothetical protein